MHIHEDPNPAFIPKEEIRLVVLGTMCAINNRVIDGENPKGPYFFYNNDRNHFWRILQLLFEPDIKPQKFSINEKKEFLDARGIAIGNVVKEVVVPPNSIHDPSDTVLFESMKQGSMKFKKAPAKFKKALKENPIFFTCLRKTPIAKILNGYFQNNCLGDDFEKQMNYLKSPTRCNPLARSIEWKNEMIQKGVIF